MTNALIQWIAKQSLAPYPRCSRVHSLRSFSVKNGACYVKREDELGFGVSGTKVRKYLSLLPAIVKEHPEEAILIGSAYSNHVVSFSQLLRENGVTPLLFLLGDEKCKMQGNLLYAALVAGKDNIRWVSRNQWHSVDGLAEDFAKQRKKAVVVSKGGNCADSLPGAMTLALDMIRNEEELGICFDHLLIDAGTGLTACALILAFAYLKKSTCVHVLLVAGEKEAFYQTLEERKRDLELFLKEPIPSPTHFRLYSPSNALAFGAVNATVFKTIAKIAREEGFLTDPVFTAKLFYEGRKILEEQQLEGNVLFIHSGGGLGLTGFQEEVAKYL